MKGKYDDEFSVSEALLNRITAASRWLSGCDATDDDLPAGRQVVVMELVK